MSSSGASLRGALHTGSTKIEPPLAIVRRLTTNRLQLLAAVCGALVGCLYTLESSAHMVVSSRYDILIVGFLLAWLGAGIGWLAAVLAIRPRRKE
jgi:hypothetical protein